EGGSLRPLGKGAARGGSDDPALTNATTGPFGCCARAASGHAAAPPSSVMKSRRFTAGASVLPTETRAHISYGRRRLRCGISVRPMTAPGQTRSLGRPLADVRITRGGGRRADIGRRCQTLIGSAQIIVAAEVLAPFADVEGPEPV